MKLELRHLVGYLPYDLKTNEGWIIGLSVNEVITKEISIEIHYDYSEIKPILRPLSDLKKEEFNYLYTLLRVHLGKNKRDKLINEGYGITDLSYFIFEQLLENHFDMFNLIKNDLAVDINTL